MTPDFKITVDGSDITAAIGQRLLSLTLNDEVGLTSDNLELLLDNRDSVLELPPRGAVMTAALGYKETGLFQMGKFMVDEVEYSFPACRMTITARSSDSFAKESFSAIKALKSKSWHDQTYAAIAETIATEHRLKPLIDGSFKDMVLDHADQTDESDLAFLNRIVGEAEGYVKAANGLLVVGIKGSGKVPGGEDMPETTIKPFDISNWRIRIAERGKFLKCEARYHDRKKGSEDKVSFGETEPAFCLPYLYASRETASRAAKAKLKALEQGVRSLDITCEGNPKLMAESVLNLTGISPVINGRWIAETCSHELSASGYQTRITATKKE